MNPRRNWKIWILGLTILFWLSGYWFIYDGWWHRHLLKFTVLPTVLVQLPALWKTARTHRWLQVVTVLLLYQAASRLWADSTPRLDGSLVDTLFVLLLLISLIHLAQNDTSFTRWFTLIITVISCFTTIVSLATFYSLYSLADDRFRNIYVYETGLNPVLTGLLCGFGAICTCSLLCLSQKHSSKQNLLWQLAITIQVFGLFATQSRTAMIALMIGVAVLLFFHRRQVLVFLSPVIIGIVTHTVLLAFIPGGNSAVSDLVERGSTGRVEIYKSFLKDMSTKDALIGKGMGAPSTLAEDLLGWHVAHPHSSYLTQYYLTGIIGTGLLGWLLYQALRSGCRQAQAHAGRSVWLALFLGNAVALAVDGGQFFSLHSIPRIEFLLVVLPAVIVCSLPLSEDERSEILAT